jgi:hypothetical protein
LGSKCFQSDFRPHKIYFFELNIKFYIKSSPKTLKLVNISLESERRAKNAEHADWALFCREMDSRMGLNFSIDRVESGADVDTMIRTFTEVIFKTRAAAVPLVCASRFCFTLSSQIKTIIAQKMAAGVCDRTAVIHSID